MKEKIILEQEDKGVVQQVVDAKGVVHDGLLDLVNMYCKRNMPNLKGYDYSDKYPLEPGKECLVYQRSDGGYNWIINKDNQVWLQRMGTDKSILKQGPLTECMDFIPTEKIPPTITEYQSRIMDDFHAQDKGLIKQKPTEDQMVNYDKVDMKTKSPGYFEPGLIFMYRRKNIGNTLMDQYPEIETLLKKANYTFEEPSIEDTKQYNTKRPISAILGSGYKTFFKNGPEPNVWQVKGKMGKYQFEDLEKIKKECKVAIKKLYDSFIKPDGDSSIASLSEKIKTKNMVHYCKNNKSFATGILGLGNELEKLYSEPEERNEFGMKYYNPTGRLPENKSNLKSIIRESLIGAKKVKERNVLGESKIVKARLSVVLENVNLKTTKQKDKFYNELLSEMIYLNSQGFDKDIIKEGFWDSLTGLLGHAPTGIMEYFKEYIGKWIVGHLTPVDPEGWIGSIIITSIGNLDIGDISKLTDCNFLTKLISKSVAEGAIRKVTHEKGLDGPFYDILRNSLVDMLDESTFAQKLEEGLVSVICPLLGGVKTKMDSATDKLKEKALSAV